MSPINPLAVAGGRGKGAIMELFAFAVTLFLVIDPFGNAPLFHAVISRIPEHRRRPVMARELLIALAILLVFLFFGGPLLGFLRLESHTLSIAGGIVLFLIALGMVFPSRNLLGGESETDEPFIVPMAVPLIAGPSAIALLLLTASRHPGQIHSIAAAVVIAWLASAAILWISPWIMGVLGNKGSRAIERLMGLILILIAVQMFLDGVTGYRATVR